MATKTDPRFFLDITRVDEEERMVWGYGTRQDMKDSYGTIIDLDSVRNCLPDYLQWRNVREMHQPSAVGTAEDVTVDDIGVQLGVHVVDDAAWNKVVNGVYKGFSIGGKKDYQDGDRIFLREITEFSLVDRPSNTGCTIDAYRIYGKENDMNEEQRVAALADIQRFAGEEIYDTSLALQALSMVFSLLCGEMSETDEPEWAQQVADLTVVFEKLKAFIASEIMEDNMQNDQLALAEPEPEITRAGSRHSAEDMTRLNSMRDTLGELGVTLCERCARVEEGAGADDDVQRLATLESDITRLQEEADTLRSENDTLRAENDTLRAENEALKAEPEPAKGITRVVGKEDDTGGIVTRTEEEPPKDAKDAIKRIHASGGHTIRL